MVDNGPTLATSRWALAWCATWRPPLTGRCLRCLRWPGRPGACSRALTQPLVRHSSSDSSAQPQAQGSG